MREKNLVRTERIDQVLVIWIDNPPINAGALGVRQGVLDAIAQLSDDASLQAAVLMGAGSTFVAGSDLREFGQPLQEPQLPVVIAAMKTAANRWWQRYTVLLWVVGWTWHWVVMPGWLRLGRVWACLKSRWA